MIETYPLTALVTVTALLVFVWVTLKVGNARRTYGVPAPATDGSVDFMRVFRVQQNTLEQIVLFLPALWLFAAAWGDLAAGAVGVFWPVGRLVYAAGYYKAAEKRGAGFGISFLATVALLLGALGGIAVRLL